MNRVSYHFNVGKFECIAVSDGFVTPSHPAQMLFKNAPTKLLSQACRLHNFKLDQWEELFTCLLIKTEEHCVLVDTGLGIIDGIPSAGKLLQNLKAEGIEPDKIDTVILSHAHGDHIGGNTDLEGRAAFPVARYFMRKEEWDFWTSETTLANPNHEWMAQFVSKNLLPIRDRFILLPQDSEIVPGVRSLFAPGHTLGNMALVIESGGDQLMYLGDAILHPIHLEHPDWYGDPDCQPDQVVHTRRLLLERAANDQPLIFAFHFDFPALGYARPQQENWKWQSIEMNGRNVDITF